MSDNNELDSIEKLVEETEAHSSAEVVVSFSPSAGNYRDLDLLWAILFGLVLLSVKIWSRIEFHPDWVLLDMVLCGGTGFLLSQKIRGLRRLFLTERRAVRETTKAAQAQFTHLQIAQTSERTGLLLHVFRLERRIAILPDSGITESLAPALWTELTRKYSKATREADLLPNLKALLRDLKGPLSRHLPRSEDDIDELPNRPVEAL